MPSRARTAARQRASSLRKRGEDFARDRLRLDAAWIVRMAHRPYARLEAFHRQLAAPEDAMPHIEARTAELGHGGLDHHVVAELVRQEEARARVDHRIAYRREMGGELVLGH